MINTPNPRQKIRWNKRFSTLQKNRVNKPKGTLKNTFVLEWWNKTLQNDAEKYTVKQKKLHNDAEQPTVKKRLRMMQKYKKFHAEKYDKKHIQERCMKKNVSKERRTQSTLGARGNAPKNIVKKKRFRSMQKK